MQLNDPVSKLWRIVQSKGLTWTSVNRLSSKLKVQDHAIFFVWLTGLLSGRVGYESVKVQFYVTYQTRGVSSDIKTLRNRLKKRGVAEFF